MSRLRASKAAAAASGNVNRALALALRAPAVASAMIKRASAPASVTRHGQQGTPVPLTRMGKPQ